MKTLCWSVCQEITKEKRLPHQIFFSCAERVPKPYNPCPPQFYVINTSFKGGVAATPYFHNISTPSKIGKYSKRAQFKA